MKYIFLILIFISFNSFSTPALICDGCSKSQIINKVQNQRPIGLYYVIDFKSEKLYLYNWELDNELRRYEFDEKSIPSSVKSSVTDYFHWRNQAKTLLNSNPDLISNLITQLKASNQTAKVSYSSQTSSGCGVGDINAYDFLSTSSLRVNVFNKMLTYYPSIQSTINSWNSFVTFANADFAVGSVEAKWLTIAQTINFEDGSSVDVVASESGNSFSTVKGSAVDCSGNLIPTEQGGFIGNFSFETSGEYEAFQSYGDLHGIDFENNFTCKMGSFLTQCRKVPSGYECTLISCNK